MRFELQSFWSPEPVIAYKVLTKTDYPNEFKCWSYLLRRESDIYVAGNLVEAKCLRNCFSRAHADDTIPHHYDPYNSCGFHGWKELESIRLHHWYHGTTIEPNWYIKTYAIVKVEFSGKVVEAEFGYRAQFQRIVEILPAEVMYDLLGAKIVEGKLWQI